MSDIVLPDLGEGVTEATIVQWLVEPGGTVARGDVLVEIMTDKVAMEIEAQQDGTLTEILAPADAEVRIGTVIGRLGGAAAGGGG